MFTADVDVLLKDTVSIYAREMKMKTTENINQSLQLFFPLYSIFLNKSNFKKW